MTVDLSDLCCVNSSCPMYDKRGAGNLLFRKFYGKNKSRFVRCRTCGKEFSERKGTPLFHLHMALEKALAALEHMADGCGTRRTARLVGVSKDTVTGLMRRAGDHALALHNELARHLKVSEAQFDEKWSFVGKKRRPVRRRRSR